MTHICVGKLTTIGSDNGLSPRRCPAIIWTSAGILLIGPLGTNFSEILIGIQENTFEHVVCEMVSICLGLNHITLCTVTYHHACNMVMIEAIFCAASLSLCYTATCYGIDEFIGSCWWMGDSKYKNFTLHIQAERTQIQWRQPSLGFCFHEDYNIMAFRICINRFWLVSGKAIILIGFPLLQMYPLPWMSITTQTKDCTASMRSARVAPISPNTLLSPGQTPFKKVFRADTFHLPYKYDIISKPMRQCRPNNWRHSAMRFLHANLMYRILLPYSPSQC